jgi:hypothetical protein
VAPDTRPPTSILLGCNALNPTTNIQHYLLYLFIATICDNQQNLNRFDLVHQTATPSGRPYIAVHHHRSHHPAKVVKSK